MALEPWEIEAAQAELLGLPAPGQDGLTLDIGDIEVEPALDQDPALADITLEPLEDWEIEAANAELLGLPDEAPDKDPLLDRRDALLKERRVRKKREKLEQVEPPLGGSNLTTPSSVFEPAELPSVADLTDTPISQDGLTLDIGDIEVGEPGAIPIDQTGVPEAPDVITGAGIPEVEPPAPDVITGVDTPQTPEVEAEERANLIAGIATVDQALEIEDPILRADALEALKDKKVPGAQIALDAERTAQVKGEMQTEANAAREAGRVAQEKAEQGRKFQIQQAREARATAQKNVEQKKRDYDESEKEPLIGGRQLLGMAIQALGLAVGSGFDRRIDPMAGSKSVTSNIERLARQKQQKMSGKQRQIEEARGEVKDTDQLFQDAKINYNLALAEGHGQLARELGRIADKAQTESVKIDAEKAAARAVAEQRAAEAKANEAAYEAELARQETRADIASKRWKTNQIRLKMDIEAQQAQQKEARLAGRGKKKSAIPDTTNLAGLPDKMKKEIRKYGIKDPWTGELLERSPGEYIKAFTEKEARDIRDLAVKATQAVETLDKMVALREKGMDVLRLGANAKTMRTYTAFLTSVFKDVAKLGAYDNGVEKLSQSLQGKPLGWIDPLPGLRALRGLLADALGKEISNKSTWPANKPFPIPSAPTRPSKKDPKAELDRIDKSLSQPVSGIGKVGDPQTRLKSAEQYLARLKELSDSSKNASSVFVGKVQGWQKKAADRKGELRKMKRGSSKTASRMKNNIRQEFVKEIQNLNQNRVALTRQAKVNPSKERELFRVVDTINLLTGSSDGKHPTQEVIDKRFSTSIDAEIQKEDEYIKGLDNLGVKRVKMLEQISTEGKALTGKKVLEGMGGLSSL